MDQELLKSKRLKRLICRDPQRGLDEVFNLYSRQIKTICLNILAGYPEQDVEEAVSQSFISLWRNIEKYDSTRGISIKSYLYGIARKTALLHRRNNPMRGEIELCQTECAETDVEEICIAHEEQKILHETISDMDEPARSIFIMKYFYFEKNAHIAEQLGINVKKVENELYRAKKRLREELLERGIKR